MTGLEVVVENTHAIQGSRKHLWLRYMTLFANRKRSVNDGLGQAQGSRHRVAGHDKPHEIFMRTSCVWLPRHLLVHASMIDGQFDASERRTLEALLRERFELDDDEVRGWCGRPPRRRARNPSTCSASPTFCAAELDQDGRKRIVEMLWEVVMADGVVRRF